MGHDPLSTVLQAKSMAVRFSHAWLMVVICLSILIVKTHHAFADNLKRPSGVKVLCLTSGGEVIVTRRRCHRGQTQLRIQDLTGLQGPQGEPGEKGDTGATGAQGIQGVTGAPGESGVLGLYGDGSSGDITIANGADFNEASLFHDVTIPLGLTVTVPSGIVIRCTGIFENRGTLVVSPFALGAKRGNDDVDITSPSVRIAHAGVSAGPAGNGAARDGAPNIAGGQSSDGLDESTARRILHVTAYGGGGGGTYGYAEGASTGSIEAGAGGGSILIACSGGIVNSTTGTIRANGTDGPSGNGAGAGGIVILASSSGITNSGTIEATGGDGGAPIAANVVAAGGGGGGGIIHLLAPGIDNSGTSSVSGGSGGAAGGLVPLGLGSSGGAGGSSGGKGGNGGNVTGSLLAASSGSDGFVIESSIEEPAFIFR